LTFPPDGFPYFSLNKPKTTMTKVKLLCGLALLAALAFSGCSSSGPLNKVGYEWDSDYDVYAYQTFTIVPQDPNSQISPILMKRITDEVGRQLEAKGLQQLKGDAGLNADIWVVAHATTKTKVESYNYGPYAYGAPYGGGWGYYGGYGYPYMGMGGTEVRSYEEGTLMLDIVDSEAKELVWRGYGSARVRGSGKEASDEEITVGVNQLMQYFPPPLDETE
jgi:hypothetical protein